ncbi:hypothetical protein UFOVP710_14 [uncultured Caudovirales phage]|uniref:Uncharacterized protein n=1 Tax=uncultured Caudovirales phage TaxID=2100421 RepID=A0A6J5NMK0_9CAUD|nr:hypothetical protein UFOVP710_14 [uncultured Caudovirales phage]
MPTEVTGALELRKALKKIEPTLAKESEKEIRGLLKVVTTRAKGYVPSEAPLSGWGNAVGLWENRVFSRSDIRRGIGYSTAPSKPNRRGFRSLATIFNKTAAGSIYETAGRKNPQGQPSQESTRGKYSSYIDTSNKVNKSANPNAGRQFIDAMPPLVDSQQSNVAGRRSRKTKGRLIFRAWAEDQGRTNAAVIKAIEKSMKTALRVTKGANIDFRGR